MDVKARLRMKSLWCEDTEEVQIQYPDDLCLSAQALIAASDSDPVPWPIELN